MPCLRSLSCLPSRQQPAEIDGGLLAHHDSSVFLHIERSLRANPHALAVISVHQPPDHLSSLIDIYNNGATGSANSNGFSNGKRKSGQTQNVSKTYTRSGTENEACLAWTYTQLHRGALRVAGGLLVNGAKRTGTGTMLLLIPNGVEYTILLWLAIILRLSIVPLDLSFLNLERHDDLREVLGLVKPSVVVVQGAQDAETIDIARTNLHLGGNQRILGITLVETKHDLDLGFERRSIWRSLLSYAASSALSATNTVSLLAAARSDDPARTFSIVFPSGRSERPRGRALRASAMIQVLESHSGLLARPSSPSPSPSQADSVLVLQQAHNSHSVAQEQALQTWRIGGTVVVTDAGFDSADLVDAIEKHRVSYIVVTPGMEHGISAELERKTKLWTVDVDVSCVKTVQINGDIITRDALEGCGRLFPFARVVMNHGTTETQVAFQWPFKNHSSKVTKKIPFYGEISPVGIVAPGAVVRIWNLAEGVVARREELGELHISFGNVNSGYFSCFSENSFYEKDGRKWFNTRNVGMMSRKGVVFILGRRQDLIQVNSRLVMPAPLESVLEKLTATRACVVNLNGLFAVLERFVGKTEPQIKRHVVRTLGRQYSLRGVIYLKNLGMKRFPVDANHSIIRAEVQDTVSFYLSQSQI